jgi:hypothetical protein
MSFIAAGRAGLTPRMITVTLAALIVALLVFMGVAGGLIGGLALSKLWSAAGLLTIVLVTAAVGLVVAGHQPRNPIGWLLAGEAVFMLLSVAAGAYADLVYRRGYRDLAFAGPPALVLSQLFSYSLAGFPGRRGRLDAGRSGAVQPVAPPGAAGRGPPVQPGPL